MNEPAEKSLCHVGTGRRHHYRAYLKILEQILPGICGGLFLNRRDVISCCRTKTGVSRRWYGIWNCSARWNGISI